MGLIDAAGAAHGNGVACLLVLSCLGSVRHGLYWPGSIDALNETHGSGIRR